MANKQRKLCVKEILNNEQLFKAPEIKEIIENLQNKDKQEILKFSNYPTFAIYLYSYCLYDTTWQQLAQKTDSIEALAELLKENTQIVYPENHSPQQALYNDLIRYALNNVNWQQLASLIIE